MEHRAPNVYDDMEQFRRDCVALRRRLGIVGNKFTAEQKETYLAEQREMWLARHPGAISGGPEPRPKSKS